MAGYSIKDLEKFTGIKAHTIRIWEQRYNLLEPDRSDTNIRSYTESDLKKLLNINLLYNNGFKISKIANLNDSELKELATDILLVDSPESQNQIEHFIQLIIDLNETAIQKSIYELYSKLGMDTLYVEVFIPLLKKIGDLWQVDALSVSHEHFFSNILREFFIVETGKINVSKQNKGKIILFLHELEMHELGLMFFHYTFKKNNYDCYYLGQKVPLKDLKAITVQLQPDYLVTSCINEMSDEQISDFLNGIQEFYPLNKLMIGGVQAPKIQLISKKNIQIIKQINDLANYV